MRQTPDGVLASLALCAALSLWTPGIAFAQDPAVEGEWVGSFGCEGQLTYFRMSIGPSRISLHIQDETMVYTASSLAGSSFEATLAPAQKPAITLFPTQISAKLVLPDDLLTGTLNGLEHVDASCTNFVMVRFVEWPAPASADGAAIAPQSG